MIEIIGAPYRTRTRVTAVNARVFAKGAACPVCICKSELSRALVGPVRVHAQVHQDRLVAASVRKLKAATAGLTAVVALLTSGARDMFLEEIGAFELGQEILHAALRHKNLRPGHVIAVVSAGHICEASLVAEGIETTAIVQASAKTQF